MKLHVLTSKETYKAITRHYEINVGDKVIKWAKGFTDSWFETDEFSGIAGDQNKEEFDNWYNSLSQEERFKFDDFTNKLTI